MPSRPLYWNFSSNDLRLPETGHFFIDLTFCQVFFLNSGKHPEKNMSDIF